MEIPVALDVEQFVLGACCNSKDTLHKCLEILKPADFSDERHILLFATMVELAEKQFDVDRVMLAQYLISRGSLDKAGGLSYITDLDEGMPAVFNTGWIDILRKKSLLRRLLHLGARLQEEASNPGAEVSDIVDIATTEVYQLSRKVESTAPMSMGEYIDEFPGGINELLNPQRKSQGLLFGFSELDRMTDGIHEKELLVIGAPQGTGKTAWALQVVKNFARRGEAVSVFSLEMGKRALFNRMACAAAEVSVNRFRRGDLNQYERDKIMEATTELHDLPIFIDETPAIQTAKLAMRLERLIVKYNIKLAVIDFLQCMKSSSPRHGISERLTEIMYDLQQIRKDTGVPMIAMSQVGRDPQKARKAPVAADTFGSASIEQTADMLGFLWREEISAPEKKEVRGLCDLMLRKNREGEVGTIHMRFIGWKQYFEEIVI